MPEGSVQKVPGVKSNFLRRFWLKYIKKEPPIVYRGEYGAVANVLERHQVDLIHVYFGHTGVHLLPFIERWPKPVVVSFHGMDIQTRAHDPSYEQKLRQLLQRCTLVLARSQSLLDRIMELGCDPAKVRMNRTGIPLQLFPWTERALPENGEWHFVQACRLIEKKGLDDALYAFSKIVKEFPLAKFTIAGEGPLKEALDKLIAELDLQKSVHFAGFLTSQELSKLYQSAHIFIHPSRMTEDQNQEGVPNSMLEAMATGLPVISTFHGGIPEAVETEKTGILVNERDRQGLIEAMFRLLKNHELWRAMSRQASEDVTANFESSIQIGKLENAYFEAIQLHSSKRGE